MSGHNKWSKIKRQKAVSDAQKSRVFSKHARLIAMESRNAKGNLASPSLVAAIERAKKESMPKDNIDRAVAKGAGAGADSLEEVIFEAYGPGGTAMVITALTDNNNRTSQEIKHLFSKLGYALGTPGSAMWAFTKTADGYVPASPLGLSDDDGQLLAELIEQLEEHEDVQDVFTGADGVD